MFGNVLIIDNLDSQQIVELDSSHYWQGLAEHNALKIREFGMLQGYKIAKARSSSFRI